MVVVVGKVVVVVGKVVVVIVGKVVVGKVMAFAVELAVKDSIAKI